MFCVKKKKPFVFFDKQHFVFGTLCNCVKNVYSFLTEEEKNKTLGKKKIICIFNRKQKESKICTAL